MKDRITQFLKVETEEKPSNKIMHAYLLCRGLDPVGTPLLSSEVVKLQEFLQKESASWEELESP